MGSAQQKKQLCTKIVNILQTSETYEAYSYSHNQYLQFLSCIEFNDQWIKFCFLFIEADIKELPHNYKLKSFCQK